MRQTLSPALQKGTPAYLFSPLPQWLLGSCGLNLMEGKVNGCYRQLLGISPSAKQSYIPHLIHQSRYHDLLVMDAGLKRQN